MSYYDTIEEDLDRARLILLNGKLKLEDVQSIPENFREEMIARSGNISVIDNYAAYKLLESFIDEFVKLREINQDLDEECRESYKLTNRLADLLREIAIALKGPEPENTGWDWSDLPKRVAELKARVKE